MKKKILIVMTIVLTIVLGYILYDYVKIKIEPRKDNESSLKENISSKSDVISSSKEENIYAGTYKQKTSDGSYPSTLILNSDYTFSFEVNLCEGMFPIKGTYKVSGNAINLHFDAQQFTGFDGENDTDYSFIIKNNNRLVFNSTVGESGVCGPFKNDIFTK